MDLAVIISLPVIALFGIMGFRDGVIKRVIEILGVFATLILTARFAAAVNPWMMQQTGVPEGPALLITWAALFFAGLLLSRLVATLLAKMIGLTILGWVDKLGGALVGVALGVLVASVVLLVISQVPGGKAIKTEYQDSKVGNFIYYAAPTFYQTARQLGGQKVDDLWDRVMDGARSAAEEAKDKAGETVDKAAQEARKKAEEAAKEALEN
jgi:uncharacterized membrane protein required for colicin V production